MHSAECSTPISPGRCRSRNFFHYLTLALGIGSVVIGGFACLVEISDLINHESTNPIIGPLLTLSLLSYGALLIASFCRKWYFPSLIAIALFFVGLAAFFGGVYFEDRVLEVHTLPLAVGLLWPAVFTASGVLVEVLRRVVVARLTKVT